MIRRIITHPGQAHRDEFIACCLLLAKYPNCFIILRAEPTAADLTDPETAVVDIGRQHVPELHNFDHHQLSREEKPTCALSLVLQHLKLYDTARDISPWIEFTEIADSKGPTRVRESYTMSDLALQASLSPIEAQLLRLFEVATVYDGHDNPMLLLMRTLGLQWLEYWMSFAHRLQQLKRMEFEVEFEQDVVCLGRLAPEDKPQLALDAYCRHLEAANRRPINVTIARDERSGGWAFYRRNDSPEYDFSKLEGQADVTFTHKQGFVAIVRYGVDLPRMRHLLTLARTSPRV